VQLLVSALEEEARQEARTEIETMFADVGPPRSSATIGSCLL
jgi:hypothetical protein